LRRYHRHPETKFLHGEAMDVGRTQPRHVFVEAIEDIGKEADKWDDEEPLTADNEFTVTDGALNLRMSEKQLDRRGPIILSRTAEPRNRLTDRSRRRASDTYGASLSRS
jgi:hypothetical protein